MVSFIGSSGWDRMINVWAVSGDVCRIGDRYEGAGGNALNAALMSSRMGHDTSLITGLGQDNLALKITDILRERGIRQKIFSQEVTRIADIALMPDGERFIFVDQSEDYGQPCQRSLDILKLSSIVDFYPGAIREYFEEWYEAAENKPRALSGIHLEEELDAGRKWEIITESSALISKPSNKELEKLGAKIFVLTDGARGGQWWEKGGSWKRYLPVKTKEADDVGAGDAFRAGLLVAIDRGLSSEKAVQVAAWAGAKAASVRGSFNESLQPLELRSILEA